MNERIMYIGRKMVMNYLLWLKEKINMNVKRVYRNVKERMNENVKVREINEKMRKMKKEVKEIKMRVWKRKIK